MKKKKILFITPSLCQGGIEHSMIQMLRMLNENKYEMYLYTYEEDTTLLPLLPEYVHFKNDLLDKHYHRSIKAISYRLSNELFNRFGNRRLSEKYSNKSKKYIHYQKVNQINTCYKNICFDVVVANSIGMTTEMAASVNAKKRYVFFRSSVDLHHELLVKLFPKFNSIIAVSQGVKKMLCENYSNIANKIIVLENYIDAEVVIHKSQKKVEGLDLKNKNNFVLSSCGRLSSEKGFDLAVEAAKLLKNENKEFIWYFIGDGNQRRSLEKTIIEYALQKNIVITGFVDNPFPYIKCCDIYIQPSYEESYGRTMKEAIILGKPVVSTNTVGGQTLLGDGKYGEIVDFSPEAIVEGIITANKKDKQGIYPKYDIRANVLEKETFIKKLESIIDA